MNSMLERAAKAAREEIVREYRDDERRKCPGGAHFYEEIVAPPLIARAALLAALDPENPALCRKMKDILYTRACDPDGARQAIIDLRDWCISPAPAGQDDAGGGK